MSSVAERSARAARAAVAAMIHDEAVAARTFTVDRFGRHRDGYLHALVKLSDGRSAYFHCRYGSWLAPGTWHGRAVLKEPEALLGSELGRLVKYELSRLSQKFHPTPAPEEVTEDEPGGSDEAVPATGVPEAGDRDDAPSGVQAVA